MISESDDMETLPPNNENRTSESMMNMLEPSRNLPIMSNGPFYLEPFHAIVKEEEDLKRLTLDNVREDGMALLSLTSRGSDDRFKTKIYPSRQHRGFGEEQLKKESSLGEKQNGKEKKTRTRARTRTRTGRKILTNLPEGKMTRKMRPAKTRKVEDKGMSAFGDGTFLVTRIPKEVCEKMTDEIFGAICLQTVTMEAVKDIGQISLKYWFIHYRDHDSAKQDDGKIVVFPKELGLEEDVATKIHFYVSEGPRTFYVEKLGPYGCIEIQRLLEKKFPQERYWMGQKMVRNVKTGRRLICFENPQRIPSFKLGEEGGYIVSVKAVGREKKCCLCEGEHANGAVECPSLAPSEYHIDLKGRLLFRP